MPDPAAIISISELNRLARLNLEKEFPLLWVAGEISNLTQAASGHVYFSLKDSTAQARCVMFRSRAQSVAWRMENGQQVEARALVSLYEARGEFQLNVESLRRAGLGRLFEAFSRLKSQLEAEGLFAIERKRPLPRFPLRIGIVSSPQAAALRDVLATLKRRAPHLGAILYPSLVQGDNAAREIANAISLAGQRKECDLLLIVRGGGSIEDLWAFNEEVLARAIVASPLPILSGVGHETDTTIADYVSDLRAATPTAAAEIATQGWHEAASEIASIGTTLSRVMQYRLSRDQQQLDHLSLRLIHPATQLAHTRNRIALLGARLDASLNYGLRRHRERLNHAALGLGRSLPRTERHSGHLRLLGQRLNAALREQQQRRRSALDAIARAFDHLNPEAILARGFSIIRDAEGQVVTSAAHLKSGQTVNINLACGEAEASILSTRMEPRPIAT
ncbi:MAG: exodeoxyribonuclease VII large subunit [Sulfuritalea sp.]|nr:exodeoxyribonuclease VII large subunit [Sulfuritalea sp.]MCF8183819.1 exodeoxyribonuclease VII large subunit [Polynucleobacter sp.]